MRICKKCEKPIAPENLIQDGGYIRNICRSCKNARGSDYYQKHKEKRLAAVKRYYNEHREEKVAYAKKHYHANPQAYRRNGKRRQDRITAEVFAAYGGKCACCGEAERTFLCIDHIKGNGNAHRKMITGTHLGAGVKTYEWLYRNQFPPGFQVLCHNCNIGKHRNKGICPHKRGLEPSKS